MEEESPTMLELWQTFDSIRCINLNSRPDRKDECQLIFDEYQIPVEFYHVDRHPISGLEGCFQSHTNLINESFYAGHQYLVIFEDDIMVSAYLDVEHLQQTVDFITTHDEVELFYLGTHPEIRRNTVRYAGPGVVKLQSICTHGYIITRKGMERYLNTPFEGVPIDYLYLDNPNSYGAYPCFFYQNGSPSDIATDYPMASAMKRYWFRWVELYSYHVNIPINVILLDGLIFLISCCIVWMVPAVYRGVFLLTMALLISIHLWGQIGH